MYFQKLLSKKSENEDHKQNFHHCLECTRLLPTTFLNCSWTLNTNTTPITFLTQISEVDSALCSCPGAPPQHWKLHTSNLFSNIIGTIWVVGIRRYKVKAMSLFNITCTQSKLKSYEADFYKILLVFTSPSSTDKKGQLIHWKWFCRVCNAIRTWPRSAGDSLHISHILRFESSQ